MSIPGTVPTVPGVPGSAKRRFFNNVVIMYWAKSRGPLLTGTRGRARPPAPTPPHPIAAVCCVPGGSTTAPAAPSLPAAVSARWCRAAHVRTEFCTSFWGKSEYGRTARTRVQKCQSARCSYAPKSMQVWCCSACLPACLSVPRAIDDSGEIQFGLGSKYVANPIGMRTRTRISHVFAMG